MDVLFVRNVQEDMIWGGGRNPKFYQYLAYLSLFLPQAYLFLSVTYT